MFAELEHLDLQVRLQIWRTRLGAPPRDELQPFYISESEIAALLESTPGSPTWQAVPLPEQMQRQAQESQRTLDEKIALQRLRAEEQNLPLRLDQLAKLFSLTRFDLQTILVCLAPELEQRSARLYAYLQDDLSRPAPTVDMLLYLLCPEQADRLQAWRRLAPQAPLRRHLLLHLLPPGAEQPFSGQTLRLDERIRRYLLDDDGPDQNLEQTAGLQGAVQPDAHPPWVALPEHSLEAFARAPGSQVLYFHGPAGVGKLAAAQALAHKMERKLLVLYGQRLVDLPLETFSSLLRRAVREALLQPALLYWAGFDLLLDEAFTAHWQLGRELINEAALAAPLTIVLAGERAWEAGDAFSTAGGARFARLHLRLPDSAARLQLWKSCLDGQADEATLSLLAARFRLSGGQIRSAAETARSLAQARSAPERRLEPGDLLAACRMQSSRKLASLAQKVEAVNAWEELVLPDEQKNQLRALHDQVRYRSRVLEDWGFGGKLSLGKGLHALFTGPPGTGKSMAAGVLAGALDLDLYKIDLSTVVSKYVGETEKNLARIFAEAASSSAILFFDEADALFGRRTEVKDSHDRYANLEVSYLLQKMDEYDGLVILASNLRQNIDRAFLRRLNFIIDFPAPGPADRLRIWQGVWPAAAPLAAGLDLPALAEQLELSGGSIRNIALSAAYLAAAENSPIGMTHLLHAAEGEYKKIGKPPFQSAVVQQAGIQPAGNGRGQAS